MNKRCHGVFARIDATANKLARRLGLSGSFTRAVSVAWKWQNEPRPGVMVTVTRERDGATMSDFVPLTLVASYEIRTAGPEDNRS